MPKDTLDYIFSERSKFARFYSLPKIHEGLHDVPERPVISNCGYYTENISHLQPLAQKVKLCIKDTNHFLSKLKSLGKLRQGTILCTIDIVGPSIPHSEGLSYFQRFFNFRDNKQISSDTVIELAEILLKKHV